MKLIIILFAISFSAVASATTNVEKPKPFHKAKYQKIVKPKVIGRVTIKN